MIRSNFKHKINVLSLIALDSACFYRFGNLLSTSTQINNLSFSVISPTKSTDNIQNFFAEDGVYEN